jgi:hypothetical protein
MFKLLRQYDYFGKSEIIEIAKGKNELPLTISKGIEQIRRIRKMKSK